jgi:hypothetical protein
MDRRRQPRIATVLPVRIWGVDAHSFPFAQSASVRNFSGIGAVLQGIRRQIKPGEILEVQCGKGKAQFRVVWVGRTGTRREGEIGIESLPAEPCIWDENLCRSTEFIAKG